MVHLPIHLAREAKLGGPAQFLWMYPFERRVQMIGQGKGRSGTGCGHGHFQGRDNSGAMSQPQVQPIGNTAASPERGESNNPSQKPLERGQISSNPWQRPSIETVSSRNLDRSVLPSPEVENGVG
nr:uncharacterized protein LOC108946087 [Nicotiana tomentosiformis]